MKPVSEAEISQVESQLSLKFAADYREYLAEFGVAAADGHEFTGIVASERLNVVNATKSEWKLNPQIPHTLYAVENAGIDGIIIWQDESGQVYQTVPNTKLGRSPPH
ncbi:MAG: SMI1/KNR4 family protein [Clostridiales bacterium]|nr:SMI1/KNR4 family protein [Clostridiales bacterium]